MTTITYFRIKSKIYVKKVPVITHRTHQNRPSVLVTSIALNTSNCHIVTFITYANIHLNKKIAGNIVNPREKQI